MALYCIRWNTGESIIWQNVETNYWRDYLKDLLQKHSNETNSNLSKKILENFFRELDNFVQVCPKEMLDKLDNPITLKPSTKAVS